MANELESLLVRLEADTASLRRELQHAENGISKYEKGVGGSLRRAESSFNRYQQFATRQLQAVAAAATAAFSANAAGAAVSSTARIEAMAEAAGMTATKYQELRAAAQMAGVAQAEFDSVMNRFAESAGAARTGTGDLYDFLKFALPTIAQQIRGARDTADAFDVAVGAAARLSSAEERAIYTKKVFGEVSIELSQTLQRGAGAMAASAAEAQRLGLVLDADMLRAARETKREYDALTTVLDANFKRALVALLPHINGAAEAVKGLFNPDRVDVAALRWDLPAASMGQLKVAAAELQKQLDEVQKAATLPADKIGLWDSFRNAIGLTSVYARNLKDDLAAVNDEVAKRERLGMFGAGLANSRKPAATGEWQTTVKRDDALTLRAKPDYAAADAMRALDQQRRQSGGDTLGVIKGEYDSELESFRRMLEEKKISEGQFVEARGKLGDIMQHKIAGEMDREREALAQKLAPMTDVIHRTLAAPLEDAFNGGIKSADQYFKQLLQGMALAMQQALILKPIMEALTRSMTTGGTGSFMAGLFGGARAAGGPVMPGKAYLVGERGPELVVPNTAGTVMPSGSFGYAGGGGTSKQIVNIDARQSDVGVVARVVQAMQALERARPPAPVAVAATAKRFPTRR